MIDFSKLDFGAPAAERDLGKGLSNYFVESSSFNNIFSGRKQILIGNRGAGKSAIFKIIAERERNNGNFVLELSPEDYSYEILNDLMVSEHKGSWVKQGAYAAAWKYLIFILIMKKIDSDGKILKTGSSAKIYNFLRDNYKGHQDNPISILISYLKRIEGIKIGNYEAAFKSKS
ncbi:P-loop ATPase, Sll1717 family [Leptospira sp. GIMC2001]|uniref:P-loop ATPase, Sll1717 family n=1 Tax=Leptospira sp. GIMC2001 TaxID=1513297 RepID=UPI00234929B2|nr:hypothetical protein [Leptospira sp. GIMC2001]WCL51468.1 hypothetical protein O4O04_20340 [Leptospira sp. GIMC2001]